MKVSWKSLINKGINYSLFLQSEPPYVSDISYVSREEYRCLHLSAVCWNTKRDPPEVNANTF